MAHSAAADGKVHPGRLTIASRISIMADEVRLGHGRAAWGLNNRISRWMQANGKDLPQSFDDAKDKLRLKVPLN
jgi:hypothetical protein